MSKSVLQNPITVVGTPEWFASATRWVRNTLKSAEADCRPVAHQTPELRAYVVQMLGRDWSEFCRAELDTKPEWVDTIERGVALLDASGDNGPATSERVVAVLGKNGRPRKSAPIKSDDSQSLGKRGGNDPAYIKARLARDGHAELLAKVTAGEMSARAAGIKAGFVKPPDPVKAMRRAITKALPPVPKVSRNVRDVVAPAKAALQSLRGEERAALAYELIRVAEEALR